MNALYPNTNHRVLVVDDNPAIHHDFRKIFRSEIAINEIDAAAAAFFEDEPAEPAAPISTVFSLDFAHQGREGLEMVEAAMACGLPYAMAFVDVRMPPGWDGIETIDRIWKVCPELQVVICTAYSDYSWEQIVMKLPTSDQLLILKKPFDNIEVLQMASALTAKWHLLQLATLNVAKLETMAVARAAELFKLEGIYRLIVENSSDLITILTPGGARLYASPSHQTLLGTSQAAVLETPLHQQAHPGDSDRVRAVITRVARTGAGEVVRYRIKHRDGSWRVFDAHFNPVLSEQGDVEHLVVVARNAPMGPVDPVGVPLPTAGYIPWSPEADAVYDIHLPE